MTKNTYDQLFEEFMEMMKEILGGQLTDTDKNVAELSLTEDLNLDSLDVINFLFQIEQKYGVTIPEADIDAEDLIVLGNLARYIAAHKEAGG